MGILTHVTACQLRAGGVGLSPNAEASMSTPENRHPVATTHGHHSLMLPALVKKLAIWALFLLVLYLARDFFFTAFMTFMFSYVILALVGWGMQRLAGGQERPGLRRLLTVALFVLLPVALAGVGFL